jgi:hypothetical protein
VNTELVEAALSAHSRRLVVLDCGEVSEDLVREMVECLPRCAQACTGAVRRATARSKRSAVRSEMGGPNLSVPHARMSSMSKQAGASGQTAKPLKARAAAARLNIGIDDLPDLGRPWTTADVLGLRGQRPQWLTAARRRYAVEQKRRAEDRGKQLAAMLDAGGFTRPDDGCDAMIPYADEAYMYLLMVKKVPDAQAQRAVDARWPSVADYEFDDEEFG